MTHPFLQVDLVCITVCPASMLKGISLPCPSHTSPLTSLPQNREDRQTERERGRETEGERLTPTVHIGDVAREKQERARICLGAD